MRELGLGPSLGPLATQRNHGSKEDTVVKQAGEFGVRLAKTYSVSHLRFRLRVPGETGGEGARLDAKPSDSTTALLPCYDAKLGGHLWDNKRWRNPTAEILRSHFLLLEGYQSALRVSPA